MHFEFCYILVSREEYLSKIEKRVKDYKIEMMNEPRVGKKLLVLDIDYTLFGKWALLVITFLSTKIIFVFSYIFM